MKASRTAVLIGLASALCFGQEPCPYRSIPAHVSERQAILDSLKPHLEREGLTIVEGDSDAAGHSRIFFATDRDGKRYVIKVPRPKIGEYKPDGSYTLGTPAEYVAALRKEIEIGKALGKHPNLLELPETLLGDEQHYFAVLPFAGRSLNNILENDYAKLPQPQYNMPFDRYKQKELNKAQRALIDQLIQVTSGLEHMHEKGYVHGDIKPANILVDKDGTARLTDFGLTTKVGESYGSQPRNDTWASPIQSQPGPAENRKADKKDDIYGLMVILQRAGVGDYRGKRLGINDYHQFANASEFKKELERLKVSIKDP